MFYFIVTRMRILGTVFLAFTLAACVSYTDPDELRQSQTMDLCKAYASSGPQPPFGSFDPIRLDAIRSELESRQAVSESDWELIDKHKAHIGMQECALVASWGEPKKITHAETPTGLSAQYVFGSCPWDDCPKSRQYAYVANGKVIGLQY